ncbi:hypothetical protein, partial [Klebsiella pneumoniae]|uniref:hypothetical protein n=1 Tax=Klebsiella pneumoniae TaxID=573 RepID=UPI0038D13584
MIEWIIRRSVANRFLVMMAAEAAASGACARMRSSAPAILASESIRNRPLATTMLSVPGAKTVRGFSQFGDSYVYVIFEDGTD